jgi:exodeoxyribonuclease VII large subunit
MALTINELSNIIKEHLPKNKIKLKAEINQLKFSGGHLYLDLKDNTGIISAIIWKDSIKNMDDLVIGDYITIFGKLNYYSKKSSLTFIINEIINKEGDGQLKIQYNRIKQNFEEKGYFLSEHKLKIPNVLTNILILTSKTGAAIEDFLHTLKIGNIKINYDIIDVIVQGENCPFNICNILNSSDITNNKNKYELIVIMRGGGSFEDLFGFSHPELIETVYNLNIPVLSAIGHQIDTTLLDYVADFVSGTPSLAGQFIVEHNKKYIDNLNNIKKDLFNIINNKLYNSLNILEKYKNKIKNQQKVFDDLLNNYKFMIHNKLNQRLLYLEKLSNKYTEIDNIVLYNTKNNIIDNREMFNELCNNKKKFYIKWGDIIIKVDSFYTVNI